MIDTKQDIIFVHIPKTGGESIRSLFNNDYTEVSKHATALQIKEFIKNKIWNDYFKFCFVRNPFDQAVSQYTHLRKLLYQPKQIQQKYGKKIINPVKACKLAIKNDFPTYAKKIYKEKQKQKEETRVFPWPFKPFQPLSNWATDEEDNIILDFIGKFENLENDFSNACNYAGIKNLQLPFKNKSKRKHYREYYNKETKRIIANFYKKDLEMFNYTF